MIRSPSRGLAERKLRSVLTALAIVLGVAMVSGALHARRHHAKGADSLSAAAYDGTDAVVSAKTAFDVSRTTTGRSTT